MPATIVARRDVALERGIADGVVFDLHGHALDGRIARWPLGHGPAFQRVANLEAKVMVPPRGVVKLHYKDRALPFRRRPFGLRLRGFVELPLALVEIKRHALFLQFALDVVGHGPHFLDRRAQAIFTHAKFRRPAPGLHSLRSD